MAAVFFGTVQYILYAIAVLFRRRFPLGNAFFHNGWGIAAVYHMDGHIVAVFLLNGTGDLFLCALL